MAQVEGIKTSSLQVGLPAAPDRSEQCSWSLATPDLTFVGISACQAVAFHLFTKCRDQSDAFQSCYTSSDKPSSKCAEEYKALTACASAV